MPPLIVYMLVIFVMLISVRLIYRQHKRRKEQNLDKNASRLEYELRINVKKPHPDSSANHNDYITKYNSPVDYREVNNKDNYDDWG